ncbi:MAG TPA: tetratricopeptide repeat protein [Bryobacteraceae bacterium]|nr:tetratricopeptide repeat protein [Bryobacteraceae bacterium]
MPAPARLTRAFLLTVMAVSAQSLATLEGTLRDSQGHPVAAAIVDLQPKPGGPQLTAKTDAQGRYRFPALPAGNYTLRARADGGEASAGPFTVAVSQTKTLDLTLQYAFFDEPDFIVAGVTDTTAHGGHGSDTVMRSAESLTRATVSLEGASPAAPPAAAEMHHSRAVAAENQGNPLEAVREYQRAAEMDSSETNLFDWGAELLKHRAAEPATEVFNKGNRLFPRSLRMLLGLAASWYVRGSYDRAAERFFEACDLDPANPEPYLFLGKVQSSEITRLPGYTEQFARFAARNPDNPWANYYYAVSLWKQRQDAGEPGTPARVRQLLEKAIRLDPALGAAYLQLGIVFSGQQDYPSAISAYRKAIEVTPQMEEPHYRLGQAYERVGEKEKARTELDLYQQMSQKSAEQAERERLEIRQFVYSLRGGGNAR